MAYGESSSVLELGLELGLGLGLGLGLVAAWEYDRVHWEELLLSAVKLSAQV